MRASLHEAARKDKCPAPRLASGQTQQNFSFIQAAKGRRSGEVRRMDTPLELDRAPWEAEGIIQAGVVLPASGQSMPVRKARVAFLAKPKASSRATWYRRGNR